MSADRSQQNKIQLFDAVLTLSKVVELILPRKGREQRRANFLCFNLPFRESMYCCA